MGRDRGRLWITTAGRNEELVKQMEERFKLFANSMTPIPSAIQPIFNPVHKEMLRTCPFEDEWDLYTKPLLTMDEIRKTLGLEPEKTVLYADNIPYEWDDKKEKWKCPYCGGIRTGDRCQGCGAPRTKAKER